jgi:hypothetical protein
LGSLSSEIFRTVLYNLNLNIVFSVSIWNIQPDIGYGVGTLLTLNIIALGIASLAAAFIPECPYNSSFSTVIRVIFQYIRKALKLTEKLGGNRWLRTTIVTISWFTSGSLIAYATITSSSAYYLLVFIPIAITFEYATDDPNSKREINHKPQKYRLPHLTLGVFIIVASILAAAGYFRNPQKLAIFITLYVVGMLLLFLYGSMASKMSKSLDETTEIDAITWVLKLETSPDPELFKKLVCLINNSRGASDYRPKMLESLMPLLSRVIVSPDAEPKDLETYVSCLAYLAEFEDYKGSNWLLWEDARYHPKLDDRLRDKLVELVPKDQFPVGKGPIDVLRFYGLDSHGRKLDAHVEKPPSSKKRQISGDAASIQTVVETAHSMESAYSYEDMELHPRRKGGYSSVDAC